MLLLLADVGVGVDVDVDVDMMDQSMVWKLYRMADMDEQKKVLVGALCSLAIPECCLPACLVVVFVCNCTW